jgi:phosphatidate phosphatase LPIN
MSLIYALQYVDIEINNRKVAFLKMKLGENGVACFVEEMKSDEELPDSLITSPITPTASSDEETNTRNIVEPNARSKTASTPVDKDRPIRYKRTLNLNSDQLKGLRLKFGMNEARFSISTRFQGRTWCSCHIYLLKPSERIVISDIDGTITKSDVLGHIIPAIGGTWAHTNIVDLYGRIQNNG